jgi:hypothetical protein
MEKERIIAIVNFLDGDICNMGVDDETTITVDGNTYKVLTDSEADEEFREYEQNLLDEMGIECFAEFAQEYILTNFVDIDWFNTAMRESYQGYVEDIKHEEGRFEEEMEENGCETEEEYVDYLCGQYEDGVQWYKDDFGLKDLSKVVKDYNLLDEDKVIDYILEEDGRGGSLAHYDGIENEQDGYFIYQIG